MEDNPNKRKTCVILSEDTYDFVKTHKKVFGVQQSFFIDQLIRREMQKRKYCDFLEANGIENRERIGGL